MACLAVGTGFALDRTVRDSTEPRFPASGSAIIAPGARAGAGPVGAGAATGAPTPSRPGLTTPGSPEPPLRRIQSPPAGRRARPTASPSSTPGGAARGPSAEAVSGVTSKAVADETAVIRLTNAERAKAGCKALRLDSRVRTAARRHSADMARTRKMSHTGSDGSTFVDRLARAGYSAAGAENVAMGYGTPAAVMKGWMASSGHRANILNCKLRAIGVGIDYRNSGPWWTQDFGWS